MNNTFGVNIIPENDWKRFEALKRYKILDTDPEPAFDNISSLIAKIFKVPICLISLVDAENVFHKASYGMASKRSSSRGISLCALVVLHSETVVFEDTKSASILKRNPYVTSKFGLRFYAGAPLITPDGFTIGSLSIMDKIPRVFKDEDQEILQDFARTVMDQIELRLSSIIEREKQQFAQEELHVTNEELYSTGEELQASNDELVSTQIDLSRSLDLTLKNESKLRYMIAEAPVAIAVLSGHEFIIESANNKLLEVWGKSENIKGKPLHNAVPEIFAQPFLKILNNVHKSGLPFFSQELKMMVDRNNALEEVYFNFVYHPMKNAFGLVESIIIIATEITEQIIARKSISETQIMLKMAVDSAALATYNLNVNTMEISASQTLKRIFGFADYENMTYENTFSKISLDYKVIVHNAVEAALIHGSKLEVEYPLEEPIDGQIRWIRALGYLIYDSEGNPSHLTGIIKDITRDKLDEQLKEYFLTTVSRELKAPLTSLNAYIQILQLKADKTPDIYAIGALEKAKLQIDKLNHLIKGFSKASKDNTNFDTK
jgi:PAS domain-containing protein